MTDPRALAKQIAQSLQDNFCDWRDWPLTIKLIEGVLRAHQDAHPQPSAYETFREEARQLREKTLMEFVRDCATLDGAVGISARELLGLLL